MLINQLYLTPANENTVRDSQSKVMPSDFQSLQTIFLDDIRTVVIYKQIPASLILNGIRYIIFTRG